MCDSQFVIEKPGWEELVVFQIQNYRSQIANICLLPRAILPATRDVDGTACGGRGLAAIVLRAL
jgi:hypothetical protein